MVPLEDGASGLSWDDVMQWLRTAGSWAWWFMTDKWLWAAFAAKLGTGYVLQRFGRDYIMGNVDEIELEQQAVPLEQWLEEAFLADSMGDGYYYPVMVDAIPLTEEAIAAFAIL